MRIHNTSLIFFKQRRNFLRNDAFVQGGRVARHLEETTSKVFKQVGSVTPATLMSQTLQDVLLGSLAHRIINNKQSLVARAPSSSKDRRKSREISDIMKHKLRRLINQNIFFKSEFYTTIDGQKF